MGVVPSRIERDSEIVCVVVVTLQTMGLLFQTRRTVNEANGEKTDLPFVVENYPKHVIVLSTYRLSVEVRVISGADEPRDTDEVNRQDQ